MLKGKSHLSLDKGLPAIIIVMLFSYDLLTYIPREFSVSGIKIIYYIIILLFYFIYIINIQKNGRIHYHRGNISFLFIVLFLFLYLLRVVFDLYVNDIFYIVYKFKFTFIFLFFNSILFPLFFLRIIDYSKINFKKLYFVLSFLISLALIISYKDIANRLIDSAGGRYSANIGLDTIAYGHLGITLFLLGFTFLINKSNLIIKIVSYTIMFLGIVSAGLANSRSPIVALMACILFYIFMTKNYKLFSIVLAIVVLIIFNFSKIDSFFQAYGSNVVGRIIFTLNNSGTTDVTSHRGEIYNQGLKIFINNPIFGNSFLLQEGSFKGSYVHNFIIESLMSLGLIGGLLFVTFLFSTVRNAYKLAKTNKKYLFISLIFIQYLIYSMFSRSILSLPLFWLSLFLVNNLYIFEKNKKILNQ